MRDTKEYRRGFVNESKVREVLNTNSASLYAYCGDEKDTTNLWVTDDPGVFPITFLLSP